MRYNSTKFIAITIAVVEIASVGLATTSASAQSSTSSQRRIEQQQRLIAQQQRQILSYQRRLAAQQQQLTSRHAQTADTTDSQSGGFLSGFCPPHYYVNLAQGCLPDLNYLR